MNIKILKIFYSVWGVMFAICIAFFSSFFLSSSISSAHALFPQEVVDFIEKNPNVTDEELDVFFTEKYGYSLEEYFKKLEEEKNKLYDSSFDVMSPSQEYLDLEAGKTLENSNKLNELTERALKENPKYQNLSQPEKNIFLENVLKLKYQQNGGNGKNGAESLGTTLKTYIIIGIEHILSGTDHILFVISLLLFPFVFRKILILISIFTLSHTITIILSGLNIVTLSSKIVEPIIALSIVITTCTAIYLNYVKSQNNQNSSLYFHAATIFIFGLFHGLGFAGAFSDLNIDSANYLIPLISMNIGVELGQLFIIMIAFPIIWIVRNQKYGNIILNIFSAITICVALFWLVERMM